MVKKIVRYSDITMEIIWLLALVSIPIYFNIYTSRVFEPDKITLFRTLMLILGMAWLVKWLAILAADRQQKAAVKRSPNAWRGKEKAEAAPLYEPDGELVGPDERPFPRNLLLRPMVWPMLLVVFVYVIATIFSVVPGVSWWGSYQRLQGTYTLVSYVLLFMAIAFNMRERRQVERLISFVLLTLIPVALYGFLQHYKADPLPWQGDVVFRVTSTMGNAIFIAAYLIMVIPLVLYRAIMTGHWLVVNRHVAGRSFKGKQRDNALSWIALYACFIVFEIGLFFAVLNFSANYRPDNSNLDVAQAAAPNLVQSSKQALEFSQLLGGDSGGPWWALPVGIALTFGLYFLFTVRRTGTDTNYLFRLFEMGGYLLLGGMTFMTILYSQSRGPELGLIAALFLFPPILFWRRKMWRWLAGWLGFGGVVGVLLLLFNQPIGSTQLEPAFKIARQNPQIARLGQFLEANDGTGRVRQLIWKTDFEIMQNAAKTEPLRLFIGYGPESLYNISPPFYQPELGRLEARNAIPDRSHNGYLDALVTTGGIGLVAYVVMVLAFFFYAFKFLRRTNRLDYQVLLAALMAIMIAHQVEIQTGIQIVASWMMLVTAIGLLTVLGGLIMGGYGRALVKPEVAPALIITEPELIAVEEPEPVAVMAASTTSAKTTNGGKKKNRNGNSYVQPVSATMSQKPAPTNGATKKAEPVAKTETRPTEKDRERKPSRGASGPGRLTPAAAGASGGAFGLGGSPNYLSENLSRPVRPWFWAATGVVALLALGYAYFANYMPIAADAVYKQGTNLASSQRWQLATPYFQEAIQLAPTEDFYYLFLGQSYLEQGRAMASDPAKRSQVTALLAQSEQSLKKAHDIAPLNPDHYANLARLYALWAGVDPSRNEEMMTKSVNYYEQVISTRAPRNPRIRTELAAAYLNLALAKKGGFDQALIDKALAAGEESVKIDDRFDFNRLVLGDIYLSARQPDKAGPHYLKLAEIDVKQLSTDNKFNDRVRAIANSSLVTQADINTAFAPKADNSDQAYRDMALGVIYFFKNSPVEAEAKLNSSIAKDRNNPYALAYLALTQAQQNRRETAQITAVDAVEAARKVQDNPQTLPLIQQMLSDILVTKPPANTQVGPPSSSPVSGPTAPNPNPTTQPPTPAPTTKP